MSKASRSEASKVTLVIKANKAKYYIADVNLETEEDIKKCAESVRKNLGKLETSFMLIAATNSQIFLVADSPSISAKDWLENSVSFPIEGDERFAFGSFEMEMAFKQKDSVRSSAFSYLRKHDLLEEEESEEEYFDF